jgi:hypothetical protein
MIQAAEAIIGHNNPPEPTPFEAWKAHLDDLRTEAGHWLDGSAITSQAEADAVSKLLDAFRKAGKDADKARAEEKRPHDEAAKAVQQMWKPLLDTAELASDTCKKVLAPWLQKLEEEQRAKAVAARKQAEEEAQKAAEALRASGTEIDAREQAEAQVRSAELAQAHAERAEKQKAHAKGGERAVGLRTYYTPVMVDRKAALLHYLAQQPDAFADLLQKLAEIDVRGGKRSIPGFEVREDRRVA